MRWKVCNGQQVRIGSDRLRQTQHADFFQPKQNHMKVIYMERTIALIPPREVEQLISSGEVKKSEQGVNYLLTIIDDGDSIVHQKV